MLCKAQKPLDVQLLQAGVLEVNRREGLTLPEQVPLPVVGGAVNALRVEVCLVEQALTASKVSQPAARPVTICNTISNKSTLTNGVPVAGLAVVTGSANADVTHRDG